MSEALPKPQSLNEADVSDKPEWVQNKPRLSSTKIEELRALNRNRLRALQSVDDMVGRLMNTLSDTGELSNTYIVFTSDNGVYLGEHRLEEKVAAYQAAPRIPLVIRGPGVPQGVTRSQMALNNDFAPTFASWGVPLRRSCPTSRPGGTRSRAAQAQDARWQRKEDSSLSAPESTSMRAGTHKWGPGPLFCKESVLAADR
jgi:arylsulfatase A-like enzyme